MKKTILLLSICLLALSSSAQEAKKYNFLLTGASFATPSNGWFEMACETLNATPNNQAVGGEAIIHTATRMDSGILCYFEELEKTDAFVIMHVHDKDVFDQKNLKENYLEYSIPLEKTAYAEAYDYVIKRYITACYNLKDNPKSKYYGTTAGKPAVIVLCTHWHDGRVTYNNTIRQLARKWGLPVVEFDRWIGFTARTPHPVTKAQTSLIYAVDTQEINGTLFGFHPERGRDAYIQQRMAAIFAETMKNIFP